MEIALEKMKLLPSQWQVLNNDDKQMLVAYWNTRAMMNAWETHLLEQEAEKARKGQGGK